MTAEQFLIGKLKPKSGNLKMGIINIGYAAELMDEYLAIKFNTCFFNTEQIKKVSKMLNNVSKEAYLQAGGKETDYNKWWNKRNSVNINRC